MQLRNIYYFALIGVFSAFTGYISVVRATDIGDSIQTDGGLSVVATSTFEGGVFIGMDEEATMANLVVKGSGIGQVTSNGATSTYHTIVAADQVLY